MSAAEEARLKYSIETVALAEKRLLQCAGEHYVVKDASEEEKRGWLYRWGLAKDQYLLSRELAVKRGAQVQLPTDLEPLRDAIELRLQLIAELDSEAKEFVQDDHLAPTPPPEILPVIRVVRRGRTLATRRSILQRLRDDGLWDGLDDLLHGV